MKKISVLMLVGLFGVVLAGCSTVWAPTEDVIDEQNGDQNGQQGNEMGLVDEETTLKLLGTEPFWAIEITPDSLTWSAPAMEGEGIDEIVYPGLVVSVQENFTTYRDTESNIVAMLSQGDGACSDGMSDRVYAYTVTVEHQGDVLRGCGYLVEQE